jgi:hypothetical protein
VACCRCAVLNTQLVEDSFEVLFDRVHADAQNLRDLAVALALADPIQDIVLPRGQAGCGLPGRVAADDQSIPAMFPLAQNVRMVGNGPLRKHQVVAISVTPVQSFQLCMQPVIQGRTGVVGPPEPIT